MELVTRQDFARATAELYAAGLTRRQIANRFGVAESTVRNWINDPDGSKQKARRARYQGRCGTCGKPTDGSNGRAKAPKLCDRCYRKAHAAEHGTISCYTSGCRCDECRAANREYQRSLVGREPPQHGTHSGYTNYGCRCDRCRVALSEYNWRTAYIYKRRYRERKRAEKASKQA